MSGYDQLPDWLIVNGALDRMMGLSDLYATSPPQDVAYLRGGKVRLAVGYVGLQYVSGYDQLHDWLMVNGCTPLSRFP